MTAKGLACDPWLVSLKPIQAPEALCMSAILMIIVFVAVIAIMNRLDFGRID
jgi:hypothetical protein